jgi:hypothetical protein
MEEPERQEPFEADRRLEYRSAEADRKPVKAVQVIGGAIASIGLILSAGVVGILASLGRHSDEPLLYVVGLAAVGCNVGAFLAYRSQNLRWLGVGMWIGFGVAALIEGACFGVPRL